MTMYALRKQRGAAIGMHGWPPDSATQTECASNDSFDDRQHYSFTSPAGHQVARNPSRKDESRHLSSHGCKSLHSNLQENVQPCFNQKEEQISMMVNRTTDIFDDWLLNEAEPEAQPTWHATLPARHPEHQSKQPRPQPHSPANLTVSPPVSGLHPVPNVPQRNFMNKGQPPSRESSSYTSTSALTSPTSEGGLSTPGTNIQRLYNGEAALVGVGTVLPTHHRFKTILPAPSDNKMQRREESWRVSGNSPFARSDTIRYNTNRLTDGTLLPRRDMLQDEVWDGGHSDIDLASNDFGVHHSVLQPSQEQPNRVSFEEMFGLPGDHENGPEWGNTVFPLLRGNVNDRYLDTAEATGSKIATNFVDPFLSMQPWEADLTGNEGRFSRPDDEMLETFTVSARDVAFQSVERGVPLVTDGEGSRRDTTRDTELLALRAQGLSYREIKQQYGFTQAESTLRGRYRALTKPREHRVRKPKWNEDAVRILCGEVLADARHQRLCLDSRRIQNLSVLTSIHTLRRIHWKKVTHEMFRRGTHPYGNGTAKKKYLALLQGHV